ncbi:AraC family transcriptional regulator [Chitinophaga niastensis]|uniref:AraC family transcriptional regulator n=1 Tax=Chitinophaga niastensis TaxID=536980 RepID=A0A2P8HJH5_CHINA|nr:helix-turn-helix transcriptional regulator [Chitinophaga niastensis]PSL46378.1 AraC family transcriptional regulator [Chitinophaga niastensis]
MNMQRYFPTDVLKPYIKTFMVIESDDKIESYTLPDTAIVMAFRYKGSVSNVQQGVNLPVSGITGLRKSFRLLDYAKHTGNLLVVFNEGGAAAFFKEPLHELFEINLSLDHLIHLHKLNIIEEQLCEAKNNGQRIAVIERFLLSELKIQPPDKLIGSAIQQIKAAHGAIRIKELAAGLYTSQDAFEKRFRRVIGTSPKQFTTIVRLRNLIEMYPQVANLTDAAHAAGYFDQAHFIKDFKAFTGKTPQVFFQSTTWW